MSPERPPRSLGGYALFLTVVNGVLHIRNAVSMSPESCMKIYKSLAANFVVSFMVNTQQILILLLRNMCLRGVIHENEVVSDGHNPSA